MNHGIKSHLGPLDTSINTHQDMLRQRAKVFGPDGLGWDVTIDNQGFEMDRYDGNCFTDYLCLTDEEGACLASMRRLPVRRGCMAIEVFDSLCTLQDIEDPDTCLEITRFCVSPFISTENQPGLASKLMWANARQIHYQSSFTSCLGVFYKPMMRVYKSIGLEPNVIGQTLDTDGKVLYAGQWTAEGFLKAVAEGKSTKCR